MTALKSFTNKFSKICDGIFSVISGVALFGLMVMIFAQVMMRYVFKSTALFGIEEAEVVPIFIIYFIGGALTSVAHGHIDCSLVGLVFKNNRKAQIIANGLKTVLYLVLAVMAIKYTWGHFAYLLKVNKMTPYFRFPVILYEGCTFIGFILMGIIAIRDAVEYIIDAVSPAAEEKEA